MSDSSDIHGQNTSRPTRRFLLDGDGRAPGRSRQLVEAALVEAGLEELRDTALLLVSELATNAVVHAASDMELVVSCDETSATVAVRDADTGPVITTASHQLSEGGRGLQLVDLLADAWGTTHRGGRKTVWFTLSQGDHGRLPTAPSSERSLDSSRRRLAELWLDDDLRHLLTFDEQVREVLARLGDLLGLGGLRLRLDSRPGDDLVWGAAAEPGAEHAVALRGRRLGCLVIPADSDVSDEESAAAVRLGCLYLALLVAEEDLDRYDSHRSARLQWLAEASDLLAATRDARLTLSLAAQLAVPRLGEWSAAYSLTERQRAALVGLQHADEERLDATRAELGHVVAVRELVESAAARRRSLRAPAPLEIDHERFWVAAVPMLTADRVVGVLLLGRTEGYGVVDLDSAEQLAMRAALAVDNARLYGQLAQTVDALQEALLLGDLPLVPGLDLAARYHAADPGLVVGGDFYDAVRLADGSVVLAIGDVCGKGPEAATVTGRARDLLRLMLEDGRSPVEALRRLNAALLDPRGGGRFCTVGLCHLQRGDAGVLARIALAGHPEPVVLRADGRTEVVGEPGDLLGVMADEHLQLHEAQVRLGRGDAIVLYTDGVTERRDGSRMFGQHQLRRTLSAAAGSAADVVAAEVEAAARAFVDAPLRDDLAILVARRGD